MGIRLEKPWIPLEAENVRRLPGQLGVYFIHSDRPLVEAEPSEVTEVESKIGEIVAGLVEDCATLQMGIGGIPNAVLARGSPLALPPNNCFAAPKAPYKR